MCKGVHLPTPLEEDHFALTPLVEMGVPPPLNRASPNLFATNGTKWGLNQRFWSKIPVASGTFP